VHPISATQKPKELMTAAREAIGERADLALAEGRTLSRAEALALLEGSF